MDGGWGPYGEWSSCPVTCNGGIQKRTRKCNQPKPQFGGEKCTGDEEETKPCGMSKCPGIIPLSINF